MSDPERITDRIEKTRIIKAPQSRVWQAIADSQQFGAWFNFGFSEPFRPHTHIVGTIKEPGFEGRTADLWIERIEPEHTFTFRWHPFALDPAHDYSDEPKTLITFALEHHPEGTRLTVTESGFDNIPVSRRAEAFRMNEGGWAIQIERIDRYVTTPT